MSVAAGPLFAFEDSYVRELEGLYEPWQGAEVANPQLVALNVELAQELGADPQALAAPEGVAVLAGSAVAEGSTPVAQAYAGHQFGGYSPRLGDGRALLLGEVVDGNGHRRDVHLKGSGRTPFARGGDGKAAIGPMLREYVISEAMHALGIPTTRSLSVVATGEGVMRETVLPGAVLARVAASHLRVGTFEYAARRDPELVRRLADYAIARHYPDAAGTESPYLTFFERVLDAQASLVARWMCVGFVHGVMNTDNMTISGETIDYGPCAFIDAFDPGAVFSSIDHGGRYSFANQPPVAQWNLARLAETLVPLVDDDAETGVAAATEVLRTFPDRYAEYLGKGMSAKLGLPDATAESRELIDDLLAFLREERIDYTSFFRALAASLRGDEAAPRDLVLDRDRLSAWSERWRARLAESGADLGAAADVMDRVNPVYIPRNHLVEEALGAATAGDLEPFQRLVEAVSDPFAERAGLERYAEPAPPGFGDTFRTFCGT